nr:hypothetical protein [Tanacetum cinerariifolium]
MSLVLLWQSEMLSLYNLLLAERYEGLLLSRIQRTPLIHNALFGTKMFINRDLPEIQAFRQRFKELPEYDENQFKISVFTPQKPVVTIVEFFHGAVKKMVSSIHECEQYKVIMRIIDQSGSAPIVFFNMMINKLSGYTAWELMKRHGRDVDDYWPGELLDLIGKRFLFKIYFSNYNVNNNNHTYRCDAVNDDPKFIKHFKDGFMQDEDSEDGFTTPANKIKVNNFTDDSLNRVLEMPPHPLKWERLDQRIPSTKIGASGSTSGSGRKRVFIDLDEIDSEDEVEGCNSSNIQKIIRVKVEKEYP